MSWKEEFSEKLDELMKAIRALQSQVLMNSKRLETLAIEARSAERTRSKAQDRMADRLIEMAMVNRGQGRNAAIHRRSAADDVTSPEHGDLWQENEDTEWPPKGHDALNLP